MAGFLATGCEFAGNVPKTTMSFRAGALIWRGNPHSLQGKALRVPSAHRRTAGPCRSTSGKRNGLPRRSCGPPRNDIFCGISRQSKLPLHKGGFFSLITASAAYRSAGKRLCGTCASRRHARRYDPEIYLKKFGTVRCFPEKYGDSTVGRVSFAAVEPLSLDGNSRAMVCWAGDFY